MHLGQSSTQNSTQQESACAPLGAGCSTRHGRCSDPPRSHHETRSCTAHRPDVTYGQVSAVLSRPCQHRQRLATLCNTAPVFALPQFLETQPPLSAPATTGNTGQRGRGNRQGIPHHVRTSCVSNHHIRPGVPLQGEVHDAQPPLSAWQRPATLGRIDWAFVEVSLSAWGPKVSPPPYSHCRWRLAA